MSRAGLMCAAHGCRSTNRGKSGAWDFQPTCTAPLEYRRHVAYVSHSGRQTGLVDIGMEMPHAAGPQDVYPVSVALWLFLLDFLSSKVLDVWRVTAVYRRASHKSFVISRLIQA
jgi:hypothetical protein